MASTPLNNLNPQNPAAFTKVLGHLKSNPQKIEEYLTTNWKDFPPKSAHDVEDLLHFCLSIIAGEMEPDQYFKKLQQDGVLKSSVCGFVWQGGDTAYKCKTCQIDSSCALCTACFQAGSHEGHDYSLQKIGGGFCDCGDPHSWKATAFCPNHKPVEGSILDQINSFPEYLVTASHAVFRAVLFRLQDLLSSGTLYADDKEPTAIVAWLDKIIRFGDFFRAVLIKELIKIDNAKGEVAEGKGESFLTRLTALDNVNIPPPLAMELHTLYFHLLIIPEFKRPFLISHFLPHYAKNIDEHAKGYRERDMFSDFTVQLFTAPPLIDVLLENKTFEMILDKLYNMLAKALVDRKPVPRAARKKLQAAEAEKIEETNPEATNPEATTTEETTEKKEEAEEGGNKRKGKRKKEDETTEDKESKNDNNNNIPPPAPVVPHIVPNPIPQYSKVLSARKPATYQSLYVIFTTDLGYLLVHQILAQKVFEDPTLSTLDLWLAVIGLVQGMNGNTVTLKTHYDPERWICSFRCELDMLGTLRPLLPSLPNTAAQMEKVVARVARSLGGWMLGWGMDQHMDNPIFFGILSQIIKGEIPHLALTPEGFKPYVEPVSFHLPVHRVLASFLRESLPLFADSNNNNAGVGGIEGLISRVSQLGTDVTSKQIAAYTLYHPLRLVAMIAQIRAGLWRSGGGEEEVWGQSVTYTSVHFQKYCDLDLFLIQVCSALLGGNEFHMLATQVFGLLSWFRLDSNPAEKPTIPSTPAPPSTPSTSSSSAPASTATPAPPSTPGGQSTNKDVPSTPFTPAPAATAEPPKEEPVANISYGSGFAATDEQNTVLAEDLLHFLITAARERMLSGFSEQQKIRREIIHRLVLGDVTHSQLIGNIQKQLVDHADFEPILQEVAIFQKPQKMDQGKYHLKDECLAEYDPYFPHYTRQELQAADEKVHDFRNKSAPKTPATPSKSASSSASASAVTRSYAPTMPQTPYPALSNLGTLLHSRFLHQLIFTVLFNVTNSSALVTDAMLTHIFYLIELCTIVGIPENDKDYENASKSTIAPEIPNLTINIDFPSANNLLRNAGHEVNISNIRDSTSGSTKASIVQLLVKLQYLPTTPAEQKEIISRILKKMADADSKLRDQIEVHTSTYVFASKGKRDKEDEDEKKRKARARQAAILQQMKSRQSAFESQLLMADDEDDMDDMGEGEAKTVIPTNTTSDGEVVSSTCALCREGGNLTARPLGHVAFVQRSVVLALSKWGPEVRRARIETAIAPHAHAHASGAQGDASASGASAQGTQEGERMEISEPPTPASPRHNPRIMFAGEEMEFDDEFETDDEEEADFPGSEADDDDDETAKALRYMYNIAHGYYAGVPAEQGMAPPAEIPQHFPQFHPQSDEGDEDDEDDDEDDSDEELFDSDDELVIEGDGGIIDGEEGEDDEDDDEDDDQEAGPWDSDDDQQLDQIMKDIVDDIASGTLPEGEGDDDEDDDEDDIDDDVMNDDEIQLVVVDKKKEGEDGEKKPAAAAEGTNNNNNASGEWVSIPGLPGPRMQVHREGDGLFEVRVRMDPEWISQHGGSASASAAPLIVDDEDEEDDGGEIPPLDLWAPTDKVDTSKPTPQNKVALGRNFSSLETFRDLEGSVGTHLTFCGHVIHHDCFNNYFSALIRSHFQDNAYEGEDLIVLEKGEFLCPLCRRIGNCLIPIVPDSTFTFPKPASPSAAGTDLEPLLQGLHEHLNPVNVESNNNSNTAPTPPNNFDTAVEQVANRVYCVQHSVGFESLVPSTNTGPNLVAALASAVACNELAQRNNESRVLVGSSTQRSDLRAFYRSCVTRLSSHPLPAYDSKCSWNMIAGLPVPPLPLPAPPTTTETTTATTTKTDAPESTTTTTTTTTATTNTTTPAVSADNKNDTTTTTTTTSTTTATTTQELHFPPLLGTDLFHLAVQLSLHIPFDTSKFLDIVRILFDAEILQILLHYKLSIMVPEAKTQPFAGDSTVYPPPPPPTPAIPKNDSFYSLVLSFFDSCTAALPPSSYSSPLASSSLASPSPASPSFIPLPADHAARTKALALPFLRRCAMFFHTCLFGAHPPAITNDEFDNLSDFLHLPKLETVVDGILRHQNSLAAKWVAQYASSVRLIDESLPVNILSLSAVSPPLPPSLIPHHAPAHPFRLISLPTSYQAVYQYCTTTPCRVCGQVSSTPGMCLVCGCIVCLGTPCCRDGLDRGEGSVHSATCSVATPFLVAKSTAVLLLRGERHAFWGSPYLDEHGEEDSHLRRGKPLYLNPSRYEQLAYMVGACQLESDSKVIESSSLVDAEWY